MEYEKITARLKNELLFFVLIDTVRHVLQQDCLYHIRKAAVFHLSIAADLFG